MESVNTSTATSPMEIPLDPAGKRGDRPRDVDRVVLRVVVASESGCGIEGHRLAPGEHHITVYADRVERVEARVRRPEHTKALEMARKMAARDIERWIADRCGDLSGIEADLRRDELERQCPISPYQAEYLVRAGEICDVDLSHGIPPLASCDVVSEWARPITPENATRAAHQDLARAIVSAINEAKAERGKSAKQ